MKQIFTGIVLLSFARSGFTQGLVIMKIADLQTTDTLMAFESNVTNPASIITPPSGGGGAAAVKASFDNIKVVKNLTKSTQLIQDVVKGTHIATVEFDFQDPSHVPIYTITISDVLVSKFSYLIPQCVGCQKMTNEVWFAFTKAQYKDLVTGFSFTWNIQTNSQN